VSDNRCWERHRHPKVTRTKQKTKAVVPTTNGAEERNGTRKAQDGNQTMRLEEWDETTMGDAGHGCVRCERREGDGTTEDEDAKRAPKKPEERHPGVDAWNEKTLQPMNAQNVVAR